METGFGRAGIGRPVAAACAAVGALAVLASCAGGSGNDAGGQANQLSLKSAPTVCSPLAFGAVADGLTDNTAAIQNAIDSCATMGGGTVELSASGINSVYVTGPIQLASNVYLNIDDGVTLLATNDHSRYVPAYINWVYRPNEALISANGATNVGITGSGTIDGAADQPDPKDGGRTWHDVGAMDSPTLKSTRPWVIEFYLCEHVTISGVTIRNHPYWLQAIRYSTDVVETGLTIDGVGRNSDGVDLVGVTNATISDLYIRDSDDYIAVKSGLAVAASDPDYALEKGLPQIPSSNIYISNITGIDGQGISIGSEAVNGVHDVIIENVDLYSTRGGFRIKTGRDRGGDIYAITVRNFVMHRGNWPLIIDSYYSTIGPGPRGLAQPITARTPHVHDIYIQHLVGIDSSGQSYINGLPESCIRNVTLDDVDIETSGLGLNLLHMTGAFKDVTSAPVAPNPPFVVDENVTVVTLGTTPAIPNTPPLSGQLPCE
jgi:polygalacturonase